MSFPNRLLSPSTWRLLGLGMTTAIFSLGAAAILQPLKAADMLGVASTTPERRDAIEKSIVFLGARDLCIATALFWLHCEGKQREMGILMTSGITIYVLDIWVAAQGPRGWDAGVWALTGAAAIGTIVGLGLLQS